MSGNNQDERYRLPARFLHWLVALLIPIQLWLGWAAEASDSQEVSSRLIWRHYQLGILIAALMVFRFTWRLVHGAPKSIDVGPAWRRRLASIIHWLIYSLLLILPLSGYVIWVWMDVPMDILGVLDIPRLFTPPNDDETGRALAWYIHYWSGWALLALILLHVGAASWHQWIRRDRLIQRRML